MRTQDHWSRFAVKQIYEKLRLKHSFVGTFTSPPRLARPLTPVHDSRSVHHGWEWYEMSLYVHWIPSSTTLLCFDLPTPLRSSITAELASGKSAIDFSDPYSLFTVPFRGVLSLYDDSVWAIRDHICSWEVVGYSSASML